MWPTVNFYTRESRGRFRGGSLGSMDPPGLHRYIEQYVYYPAVVLLSAFTVRSIIFIYKCGDSAY